jgi:hypothetical protein
MSRGSRRLAAQGLAHPCSLVFNRYALIGEGTRRVFSARAKNNTPAPAERRQEGYRLEHA